MDSGNLDFNLTSMGVQISGRAETPEELAAFIVTLRRVLDAFETIAAQGIEAATAGETREAGLDPKDESPVAGGDAPNV